MPAPSTPTTFAIAAKSILAYKPGTYKLSNKPAALLTWDPQAAVSFRIEKQLGIGADWEFGAVIAEGFAEQVIADLPLNTQITFRIRAEDAGGVSSWASSAAWTTPATLPANAAAISLPTSLAVTDITSDGATVTWDDNSVNEGAFEIRLTKPGTGYSATVTQPLEESHRLIRLEPSTGYLVALAARGGKSTKTDYLPIVTAFTAEVAFATTAAAITIDPLPARLEIFNGHAMATFTVGTSETPSTAFTVTGMPTGLSFDDANGEITGTPSDTPGLYVAEITATNGGGTDVRELPLVLITPSLLPLWAGTQQVGHIGDAFSYSLPTLRSPLNAPLAAANAFTCDGLPAWATLNTGTGAITGTPTGEGEWSLVATASNGTESCEAAFTILVPGVEITSAASLTAYVGQEFSLALTASDADAEFSCGDTMPNGVTVAGNVLGGTPTAAAVTELNLVATLGESGDTQLFTLTVLPLFKISDETVDVWIGEQILRTVRFSGAGTVRGWSLTGAPAGLVIADATDSVFTTNYATLSGAAAAGTEGIYNASIVATVYVAGELRTYSLPITITVSGGLFLGWLHDDYFRADLQIFLRDRSVRALQWETGEGWWLKRGDVVTAFIVFRDGPNGDDLGRTVIEATEFDSVTVTIRPLNDFDADPLIEFTTTDTDTIGDHEVFVHEFTVVGDALEAAFIALNETSGAESAAATLACMGEVTWISADARTRSSRTFTCTIAQDASR